jgi:hypothetical protein
MPKIKYLIVGGGYTGASAANTRRGLKDEARQNHFRKSSTTW